MEMKSRKNSVIDPTIVIKSIVHACKQIDQVQLCIVFSQVCKLCQL